MAGQVRDLIGTIVRERSKGNPVVAIATETKIILNGINPKKWHAGSPDDPQTIALLNQIAQPYLKLDRGSCSTLHVWSFFCIVEIRSGRCQRHLSGRL